MRSLVTIGLVVSLSGCSLAGYPSGHGDGSDAPSIVPASSATGGAAYRSPPVVDVDSDPESATWRIPANVRPPDPGHVYEVFGETYTVMRAADGYDQRGEASWYGDEFDGRPTATGETFDMFGLSAAHRTLPLHTFVEVTNLDSGARVILRVNDRGPFARTERRIIDLSYGAARRLGMVDSGVAPVRVRVVSPPEGR